MKSGGWWRRAAVVCGLGLAMVAAGWADDDSDPGVPGGRAVRLSSVDGAVEVSQGGEVLADHAVANTPLFEGTQITTGEDGRAEIQFEDGSVARIPPESSLTLAVLKSGDTEIDLNSGMAYFELQGGSQGQMRVRFDGSVVTPNGFTVLRVKLDEGPGELAVFSGNAHLDGTSGASLDLRGGESVALNNYNLSESIEPDSWDGWNSDRDQALTTADAGSAPPVADSGDSNNPAWGDLNQNGTWYNVPDQGYVWSPYEAANPGWDPYGAGYWMWTPRYGYIWVSSYTWGYLPFQCGAWNWYDTFGWAWAPGHCNSWWGGFGGGGGWGFTIGYAPTWYRLPQRPHPPRPRNPEPAHGGGRVPGIHPVGPAPVISVNRNMPGGTGDLPSREPDHPVTIGRVIAQPVRPVGPRPVSPGRPSYGRSEMPGRPVHGQPVQGVDGGNTLNKAGNNRPTYRPMPAPVGGPQRPVYTPRPGVGGEGGRPGYTPAPQPGGGRNGGGYIPPRPAPSGGGGYRPAPTPAPAPRPSGGGGGGSHPAPSGGSHPAPSSGSHPSSNPK